MQLHSLLLVFGSSGVLAAVPFLNAPDTGFAEVLGDRLPTLDDMYALPDFDDAARLLIDPANYSYYRSAATGEYSYRESLSIFPQVKLRPRVLRDVDSTRLDTTILGHNFTAPFFIAPASNGFFGNELGESGLVRGAGDEDILYTASLASSLSMQEIAAQRKDGQVLFQQLYIVENVPLLPLVQQIEASGYGAIFVTVDNPILGVRARADRWGWPTNSGMRDRAFTWESYRNLRNMTRLPVVPKGIQTVEDARLAVEAGAPAIYISSHGGRQLDTSQTPLEVVLEIRKHAPEIFDQVEVFVDGGVRYGTDVVKLLALGVKAVGLGRPFMYANVFGEAGVQRAIQLLKYELLVDMANLGVNTVDELDASYVNVKKLESLVYD